MNNLFDEKEYEQRWKKCQEEMEKENLDVLILSQFNNVFYISGYRTQLFFSRFRPFITLLIKGESPILLVPNLEEGAAIRESWFKNKDIRIWGPSLKIKTPIELLKNLFIEKKLKNCTVGLELDQGQRPGMIQAEFESLKGLLKNCRIKSCSSLMWKLRRIKSKKEIEFLKEAARISEKAFDVIIDSFQLGMTEKDIQKIMGTTILNAGGELQGFLVVASGKERYDMANPWPSDRKLEKGDMVILDYGAVFNGYWSDLSREFFVGLISSRQRELYEAAHIIHNAAVEVIKPGVPIGEIDIAAMKKIKNLGYEDLVLHRTGHAIGLELHEMPSISSDEMTPLQPGMCFCIEPAIYDFSSGCFRIEDEIVITEEGYSYLSRHPKDAIIR